MKSTTASGGGNDIMMIVQAYGKVLETDAPTPGTVADASKLPYPKQQIKEALVAAIAAEPDHQTREHLKVAYISLADWQDGVGVANKALDVASLDRDQGTNALAKQVVAAVESGKDWTNAAKREAETLKKELEELGLW